MQCANIQFHVLYATGSVTHLYYSYYYYCYTTTTKHTTTTMIAILTPLLGHCCLLLLALPLTTQQSRKIRNEAGVIVTAKKEKVGVMYNKWQKKSKRAVGREGDEEDNTNNNSQKVDRRKGGGGPGRGRVTDAANGPNARHNAGVRDELRDGRQIRKVREQQENKRLRSMPRAQRAATLKKGKASYDKKQADKRQVNFRGRTRSRVIIRA
jgi:hypothetical protein